MLDKTITRSRTVDNSFMCRMDHQVTIRRIFNLISLTTNEMHAVRMIDCTGRIISRYFSIHILIAACFIDLVKPPARLFTLCTRQYLRHPRHAKLFAGDCNTKHHYF